MKILSNKKYNDLVLKSCKGMFGAVNDDMLLRNNAFLNEENKQLKEDKKKAIEWVNNHINKYQCKGITIIDWDELSNPNDLLEILGDKE